jgi:hypothetical protein
MAVRIPIITVFDSKGLKAAEYQLRKVSNNVNNLSRNFAVAGAAFAGIAVGLGKSVKVASDLGESVNAVNVAFGKSAKGILDFGRTASRTLGVSAVDFNNAAVRFSAFADRIVGSGNDASGFIREITTRASDFASVFNIEVAEALQVFQSGLAGEAEPLKRFGINLLDSEVKAYALANGIGQVGRDLTETEKVQARYGLLLQATNKTAGDFANTSDGLANGMRILNAELTNAQAEIGQALLPAIQDIIPILRELSAEFGTKLKTAVEAVDWRSVITLVANLLTFFVQHIETIVRVVAVLWTLNTAYNAIKVTVGLTNAAIALFTFALGGTEAAAKRTTAVLGGLRTALLLGGVTLAVGSVIDEYRKLRGEIEKTNSGLTDFNKEALAISGAAAKLDPMATLWNNIARAILGAVAANRQFNSESGGGRATGGSVMDDYAYNLRSGQPVNRGSILPDLASITTPTTGGGGSSSRPQTVAQVLKREGTLAKRESKLLATGVSAGLAQMIVGTATTKKTFQKELSKLTSSTKAVSKAQAKFNKTAAGKAELAAIQATNDQNDAIAEANRQAGIAAAAAEAAREAAILAEKQRVYESFAGSIANTFSRIKESILSAFSLPSLGGSTDSIIRNMDKLLTRVKAFSANITKLSSMGLDPKLLQQVINAGPIAGAKLAANLVAGGVGGLAAINRGYSELGAAAGEIAMTGTQAQFQTAQQQQIININIEGGLDSSAAIGKAVVDAVRAYERTSGAVWQGA